MQCKPEAADIDHHAVTGRSFGGNVWGRLLILREHKPRKYGKIILVAARRRTLRGHQTRKSPCCKDIILPYMQTGVHEKLHYRFSLGPRSCVLNTYAMFFKNTYRPKDPSCKTPEDTLSSTTLGNTAVFNL